MIKYPEPSEALEEKPPPPLEFFTTPYIHPDNQQLAEETLMRFRALGRVERMQLRRQLRALHKLLRGWNDICQKRDQLWEDYKQSRDEYLGIGEKLKAEGLEDTSRAELLNTWKKTAEHGKSIAAEGRRLNEAYEALTPTYLRYRHLYELLEHDEKNHARLVEQERIEKQERAQMRTEAKWIERLIIDVFKKTKGCHYTAKDNNGREYSVTPRFHRSFIDSDSHWFWLKTSYKGLFGWSWTLPYGVNIEDVTSEATINNMMAATGRQIEVHRSKTNQIYFRVLRLDSPNGLPKRVLWRDVMRYFPENERERFPWIVGAIAHRKIELQYFDDEPHMLVGGMSKSGKSNFINQMLATLATVYSPDEMRVVFADLKGGVESAHWKGLPHILGDMPKSVDETLTILEMVVDIMNKRLAMLEKVKAKEITAYNKRVPIESRLPRIFVLIDELNTFLALGSGRKAAAHNLMMLIGSQGRAVGLHLIPATQHPTVEVVPGIVKTNLGMRISGFMPSVTASMIVLDSPQAANLPRIRGRMMMVCGDRDLEFQAPYVEDSDIANVLRDAQQKWEQKPLAELDGNTAPTIKTWDEPATLDLVLLLGGHLSAEKMHTTLGEESPGEHHFKKMVKSIRERQERVGYIKHNDDYYTINKNRRAYQIVKVEQSEQSDDESVSETEQDELEGVTE